MNHSQFDGFGSSVCEREKDILKRYNPASRIFSHKDIKFAFPSEHTIILLKRFGLHVRESAGEKRRNSVKIKNREKILVCVYPFRI